MGWGGLGWGGAGWGEAGWGGVGWGRVGWVGAGWGGVKWGRKGWGGVEWGGDLVSAIIPPPTLTHKENVFSSQKWCMMQSLSSMNFFFLLIQCYRWPSPKTFKSQGCT